MNTFNRILVAATLFGTFAVRDTSAQAPAVASAPAQAPATATTARPPAVDPYGFAYILNRIRASGIAAGVVRPEPLGVGRSEQRGAEQSWSGAPRQPELLPELWLELCQRVERGSGLDELAWPPIDHAPARYDQVRYRLRPGAILDPERPLIDRVATS